MKKSNLVQTLLDSAKEMRFEKATIRRLEELNIPPVKEVSARQIQNIRKAMNVSQGVFAEYLNVNPSTLQKWEQGSGRPSGATLKLFNIVQEYGPAILYSKKKAA